MTTATAIDQPTSSERTDLPRTTAELVSLAVCAAGVVFLIALTLVMRPPALYDEPHYLGTVALIQRHGFSTAFLRELPGPAGPLYTVVHYLMMPLTGLRPPGVRLVNIALLLLTMAALYGTLRSERSRFDLLPALSAIAVPMMWVLSGMALTEMPAVLFCAVCLYLLSLTYREPVGSGRQVALAAAAGLALAVACMGRQTYLAMVLPLGLLLLWRRSPAALAAFAAASLLPCLALFSVWGGLVPEKTAYVGKGLSISHGILSMAYASAVMLILAPRWFTVSWKAALATLAVALAVNVVFKVASVVPFTTTAQRYLPPPLVSVYSQLTSGIFVGIAFLLVLSFFNNVRARKDDPLFVCWCIAAFLLLLTPMKVTHLYSSRYTATAVPLLILMASRYTVPTYFGSVRLLIGMALGCVALLSYLTS